MFVECCALFTVRWCGVGGTSQQPSWACARCFYYASDLQGKTPWRNKLRLLEPDMGRVSSVAHILANLPQVA